MHRARLKVLEGSTRPFTLDESGILAVMDPDAENEPSWRTPFLDVRPDWAYINTGTTYANVTVTLRTSPEDPGPEEGWDEVTEKTITSNTGALALCRSAGDPFRADNLACAGRGDYILRVYASDRRSEDEERGWKKPTRLLIQVFPTGVRLPEPEAAPVGEPSMLPESDIMLLVRTCYDCPDDWRRLLESLDDGADEDQAVNVEIIDTPAYSGLSAEQLLALIGRDEDDWPHHTSFLVADEQALSTPEFLLLAVDNSPEDPAQPFRIPREHLTGFVVNMELANMDFSEFAAEVGPDRVFRDFPDSD